MSTLSPVIVMVAALIGCTWCAFEGAPFPFFVCAVAFAVGVYELHAALRHDDEEQGDARQDGI